jgi:O-antigen/teichoic acid export membrane protein
MTKQLVFARASWTLIDQCVVSGGNFLLNLLLARAMVEEDYGEFALFLGAIFVLRAIDYSFISYPLAVRLYSVNSAERATLLANTLLLALILSAGLLAVMATGVTLLHGYDLLLPACLCYLCWQAQETLRRFLHAEFRYKEAVAGDAVAYLGPVVLLGLVLQPVAVSLENILYAMSATFAVGAIVHSRKLRFAMPTLETVRELGRGYLSTGWWSLISYQLALLRTQLLPWLLASIVGTGATASLQAGLNIANMMNPIGFGIGNAVPQVAADAYRSGHVFAAIRAVRTYILIGLGPILVICGAGLLVPELLLRISYGPTSPYLTVARALQVLVIAGVLDYVSEMISKTLLGMEFGRLAFLVNVLGTTSALVAALLLISGGGVLGACLALLIANSVRLVSAVVVLGWLIARETKISGTGAALATVRDP